MKRWIEGVEPWFGRKLRRRLRQNPRALRSLRRFRCFSTDTESLSRGLAIGLFFGLTPTVGFQTPLVLPTCMLWRASFPLAFAATWVSNPITVAPLYLAFNWLGGILVGQTVMSHDTTATYPLLSLFAGETLQMLVGSLTLALPTAVLGYWLARYTGRFR